MSSPAQPDPSQPTPVLTIAIPTYNRNHILAKNLATLIPQLTADCVLTVIDNASDVPLAETLSEFQKSCACRMNIVRNRVNIGANANILRCLESCATKWIWILGDDDPIRPNAIATILDEIPGSNNALYLNFRSALCAPRRTPCQGRGISEFAEALDSFSNALFISTSIFNAAELLDYIGFGYLYAYSCAPHLAVLLAGMKEDGEWRLSEKEIVDLELGKTVDQKWSPLIPALGKMTILELPMKHSARRLLAYKLYRKPRLEYLALSLVRLAGRQRSSQEALFLYGQLCSRLYWCDRSPGGYARRMLGRGLIRNWAFTNWFADVLRRRLTHKRWDVYRGMIDQAGIDQWHRII
jgi:glycosyltransferase involved in cell wall biosynthesis